MKSKPIYFCLVIVVASLTIINTSMAASSNADTEGQWSIRLDQDALAIKHQSDTNYTMGLSIRKTYFGKEKNSTSPSWLLKSLDSINSLAWILPKSGSSENESKSSRSFVLQDNAFTPSCLDTIANCTTKGKPIIQDRPYANLIWIGASRSISKNDYSRETSEIDVGLYGTNIGNAVQTWIHERCCKDKIPQEWGTQIGDGGALTFLYKQTREDNIYRTLGADIKLSYGLWIGWNTWPTVGISSNWDALRIEYDASYVLYNQSLQGAWGGSNKIKYDYADMEKVIHLMHVTIDVNKVVGIDRPHDWGLKFSQHWKTRDLKVSGEADVHYWGGIELWKNF